MLVAQSCLTLCDPKNCGPPGHSVHGILQARILEWVAIEMSNFSLRSCKCPRKDSCIHSYGKIEVLRVGRRGERENTGGRRRVVIKKEKQKAVGEEERGPRLLAYLVLPQMSRITLMAALGMTEEQSLICPTFLYFLHYSHDC